MEKFYICLIKNKLCFIDFYMNVKLKININQLHTFLKWIKSRSCLCKKEQKLRRVMVGR